MSNIGKQFKAISFVWLLVCFLLTNIYAKHSRFDGMFLQFFMYGMFAAPVWLLYGWQYLYGKKYIPVMVVGGVALLYAGWFIFEVEHCCSVERQWLAAGSGLFFLVMAAPYLKISGELISWYKSTIMSFQEIRADMTMGSSGYSVRCNEVMEFIKAGGFIILSGRYWDDLYKMLPKAPDGSSAPRPLILGGAAMTSDGEKYSRLQSHILWADKHGVIDKVGGYLESLDPAKYERVSTLSDEVYGN